MRRMAAWHADPEKRALTEELRRSYPPEPGERPSRPWRSCANGQSMWSADMNDEFLRSTSRDERHYAILKTLGFTSYMTVPLRLRDEQVLGTVTLVSAGSGRRFSERDLGLAEQLAKQVSSVVDPGPGLRPRAQDLPRAATAPAARRHPPIDGWDVAARYRPAGVGVEVGGDWYDVVPISEHLVGARRRRRGRARPRGGPDDEPPAPHARSARCRRSGRRARRWSVSTGSPWRVSTSAWRRRSVGVLDTRTGAIIFSSAGHPSPVRVESGQAIELPVPPGPPLGVQHCHYKDHEFHLDGECLVMFTDGLVERRGAILDERFALLESSLRGLAEQRARAGWRTSSSTP